MYSNFQAVIQSILGKLVSNTGPVWNIKQAVFRLQIVFSQNAVVLIEAENMVFVDCKMGMTASTCRAAAVRQRDILLSLVFDRSFVVGELQPFPKKTHKFLH